MKITIEPFLLDNALMNYCVYALAAAWIGIRIRLLPTVGVSLLGALYALLSLFYLPALRLPYLKLPFFFLFSLPLYRRIGSVWKAIPFLILSAALVGGTAMFLTLQLGGTVYADGTVIATVPVRAALASAFAASCLPRAIRALLMIRRKRSFHTEIVVCLKTHTYRLDALIDSGNLLKEPVSGLAVILIDRKVDQPLLPIPFYRLSGAGFLLGERPVSVILPEYGNARIDGVCAQSPEPIGTAQAILPESLLPYDWRIHDEEMAYPYLGSPAFAAALWQKQYLMVRSRKRKPSAAARSGRGDALHRACADRQGGEGQADRA